MPTLRSVLGSLQESVLASLADAAGLKRLDLDALERLGPGHIRVLLVDPARASQGGYRALD